MLAIQLGLVEVAKLLQAGLKSMVIQWKSINLLFAASGSTSSIPNSSSSYSLNNSGHSDIGRPKYQSEYERQPVQQEFGNSISYQPQIGNDWESLTANMVGMVNSISLEPSPAQQSNFQQKNYYPENNDSPSQFYSQPPPIPEYSPPEYQNYSSPTPFSQSQRNVNERAPISSNGLQNRNFSK
jgi:hypothetical protein